MEYVVISKEILARAEKVFQRFDRPHGKILDAIKKALTEPQPIILTISEDDRINLLCAALEGGSNYWYYIGEDGTDIISSVKAADGETTFVDRMWETLKAGKEIPIRDAEDKSEILGHISLASISKGEQIMADKYPNHLADVLNETEDAITGDVWFQLAVLGEIIYG